MVTHAHSVRISERTHRALSQLKRSTGQSMPAIIEQAVDRWQREHLLREANAAWAAILADELGYDRARLREWGIAHAVLSACWSAEDHGAGWEDAITAAEVLIEA